MRQILSTRQIVGTFVGKEDELEVCATGEAQFDEVKRELKLQLDSFARHIHDGQKENHLSFPWLPKKQQMSESVSSAEASDLARDIFHRWVRTVRQAIPLINQDVSKI